MAGKKYRAFAEKLEDRAYALNEAIPILQQNKISKFDETVEVHLNLGVDPRHADQMVRGTVVLPHGLGVSKRVLVIASGEKLREAEEAGADFFGGEEYVDKIQKQGWLGFDAVVATPDMMRVVSRVGKILGPRGLMPNPKTGTVTVDIAQAVSEVKAGKVEFRVDRGAVIHAPVGKLGFDADHIVENAGTLIGAVLKARPQAAKGRYLMKATICSTMSPALTLNVSEFSA
ncbi:MAG: 50S ribosomal protein L1 [Bryobacterales bacterium]|nr:50S ribosomal protein L1 [Bryobacterales bacterium]MDE0622410.1 50S ribosomal protein L1 [Bryobacterales bacterium]